MMNTLENWLIKQIIRKEVKQGYDHDKRISNLYLLIYNAVDKEFYENNLPTKKEYLREWFEASFR